MAKDRFDKKKIERKNVMGRQVGINVLVFFLLTTINIFLSALCIEGGRVQILKGNKKLAMSIMIVILCVFCISSIWATLSMRKTFQKSLLSVNILILISLIFIIIFQKTGVFNIIHNADTLREYLEKMGVWMPIIYIVLQFLQVILLPIPSVVSTVAGVALFGAFRTTLYSLIGIFLGSLLAFFIGRNFGHKAVSWMVGEESLIKWQKKLKGKDNLFLTIMFVLPLFPDDILCFFAGLSSMSKRYFILMIFLTRLIGIACTCYSFDYIPFNTWWGLLIWSIFFALIVVAFIFVYRNLDKIQDWLKIKRQNKEKK